MTDATSAGDALFFPAGASCDHPFHRHGGGGTRSRKARISRIEDAPAVAVAHRMRQAVAADPTC